VPASQGSVGSAGSAEEVMHRLQSMQQTLLEQQQRDLEELFVQQRREQMLLQVEFDEHQKRMTVSLYSFCHPIAVLLYIDLF
jgi:hypothetical protein